LTIFLRKDEPIIAEAAVEAVIHLITEGSPATLRNLADADIFNVALQLHEKSDQKRHSLRLLDVVIQNLSHDIIVDENLTIRLFDLFE